MTTNSLRTIALVLFTLASWSSRMSAGEAYRPLKEIPIGGEGGWDIPTIDEAARRLYLARATKIVVVDIDAGKVVGEIADAPGAHQFLALPEFGYGFSSNGKENKAAVVDLKTLQTTSKIDTGEGPDAMCYAGQRREVYVGNHHGNSITVIDARSKNALATITLDGSPEFAVSDDAAGKVYCNIEDKSEVAVIDSAKHQVIATWPVAPGEEPTGIALDPEHHRLFAACRKMLVMLDTESGKVTGTLPTGAGADGCAFDPVTHFVIVPCGEGVATIATRDGNDHLTLVQTLKTEKSARTIALDPKTHRIFLPAAQLGPAPSPSPGQKPGRPTIVPNSLKLLVYGTEESKS